MKRVWAIALVGFALLLSVGAVDAAVQTGCNAGTWRTSTDGDIPDGYNNANCNLIIDTTQAPAVTSWKATASTIAVGPGVSIVNGLSNAADVILLATGGGATSGAITITSSSLKAKDQLNISCSFPADCPITVTPGSELIAANNLLFGGPGGTLDVTAQGHLDIQGTTTWGGNLVKLISKNDSVTFLCQGGGTACKDPTIQPFLSSTISAKCGNPPVFPCNLGTLSETEIKNICIVGGGAVQCGGGCKEFDIFAKTEINIENTQISVCPGSEVGVLKIQSSQGPIRASGAVLDAHIINITVLDGTGTTPPLINLTNASVTADEVLNIKVNTGCPVPPLVSIDLTGAIIVGNPVTIVACKGAGLIIP